MLTVLQLIGWLGWILFFIRLNSGGSPSGPQNKDFAVIVFEFLFSSPSPTSPKLKSQFHGNKNCKSQLHGNCWKSFQSKAFLCRREWKLEGLMLKKKYYDDMLRWNISHFFNYLITYSLSLLYLRLCYFMWLNW